MRTVDPMSSPPPGDPMGQFDSSASGRPEGLKVVVVVIAAVVVLLFVGLGALVLAAGGDDDGDEEASATASAPADDEQEDDASDEFEDFSEDVSDDLEDDADEAPDADPDRDGVPNEDDADDDGDGVPDTDDSDPYDPDEGGSDGDRDDADDPDDPDDEGDADDDPPVAVDLLRADPRPAIDAWLDAAGPAAEETVDVTLYPTYGFTTVRDPDRPAKVLEFGWRDGQVDGPTPQDPFPTVDLDEDTFALDSLSWDRLPLLVSRAPDELNLPRGDVTHVIVDNFFGRILFRIYVTAPNGSDYAVATPDGRFTER
jgi:hypothetical protein